MAYTGFKNGFTVGSSSAVDRRILLTKEEMVTAEDNYMLPDQYFAICSDNGKLYLFNVDNDPNNETGKYREVNEEAFKEIAKKVDKEDGKSLISDLDIEKLSGIASGATKAEASDINGNIKINGQDINVFDSSTIEGNISTLNTNKQDKLSDAQIAATSSGITGEKVGNYNSHLTNSNIHVTSEDKDKWNNKQDKIDANNKLNYNLIKDAPEVPSVAGLATKSEVSTAIGNEETRAKGVENTLSSTLTSQGTLISGIQSSLDSEIDSRVGGDNAIEEKLKKKVITSVSFEAKQDKVTVTHSNVNLSTGDSDIETDNLPLANETTAGLQSPETVKAIATLINKVDGLEGRGIRLLYTEKSDPTSAEIRIFVENKGYTVFDGIVVVVDSTKHIWRYYSSGEGWKDDGLDSVGKFTNQSLGIIKGSDEDGKIYAEDSGVGSVKGWDDVKTDITNLQLNKANSSDLSSHTGNTTIHVTSADKSNWNNKYVKPNGGIPSSDLSSSVVESLGKADSAYQKPSTGIPEGDLAVKYYPASNPNSFTSNTGTITGINTSSPLNGSGTTGSVTIGHNTSGVTSGTYGDTSSQTPSFGDSFNVPTFTVNEYGHITDANVHSVKLPNIQDIKDTTYTFESGTNGFTVTPSDSISQTVTVNPSINVSANVSNSSDTLVTLNGTDGTNGVTYSASHKASGVSAGQYGSKASDTSFNVPTITVDNSGHITSASNNQITISIPSPEKLEYHAPNGSGLKLDNSNNFGITVKKFTISQSAWVGSQFPYSATVGELDSHITVDSTPILDVNMEDVTSIEQIEGMNDAWSKIYRAETGTQSITFYATEIPDRDIPVIAKGF